MAVIRAVRPLFLTPTIHSTALLILNSNVCNCIASYLYDLGILRLLGTRRFEAANWGSRAGMGTGPTTAQCFEIPTFHSATSFSITDHLVFTSS